MNPVSSTCNREGRRVIAFFGGSFDPPHMGHLEAARQASALLGVNDFRLLPSGQPPHRNQPYATSEQRLEMLAIACRTFPRLLVDRREIDRDGPSWMVETLREVRGEHPEATLLLVVGQDAANHLDSWYQWRGLLSLASLVVVSRPGEIARYGEILQGVLDDCRADDVDELLKHPCGYCLALEIKAPDLSSTMIRESMLAGSLQAELLPPGVLTYIREKGLYR